MNTENIKNYLNLTLIVAVIVLTISTGVYAYSFSRSNQPVATFTVSAEGKVVAIPDTAKFSYSVLTQGNGDSPTELQEENTKISNAITDYLKENGVDEKDIKTENYYINPQYSSRSCRGLSVCLPAEIVGYTIEHRVSVKTTDFSKAGKLLAGVVKLGANVVSGVQLTVDDREALQDEAREKAIKAAAKKARGMAKSGKFRIGRLLSVDEYGIGGPYPYFEGRGLGGGEDIAISFPEPISVDIEPGSQEIKVNVTLRYEIR